MITRRSFTSGLLAAAAARPQSTSSRAALEEAAAAIPSLRMRDVELRLTDRAGKPLPRVPVEIAQLRQAFPVGDQTWELDRMVRYHQADTDRCRYWQARHIEALNAATCLCYWTERYIRDAPKAEDFEGELKLDAFAYCVDWAASRGLTVKGHPLFWSVPKAIPDWVQRYDYTTQMKFAEVRVRQLVSRFKGRVRIWDVVNEALWEPSLRHTAKRRWPYLEDEAEMADYIGQVLTWAREEDPDACYVLNDYGLEQDPAAGPPTSADGTKVTAAMQRERMLRLLERLVRQGTSPDAIGLQSHPDRNMDPAEQSRIWHEMASSGLPIHITEFAAGGKDKNAVADYIARMLTSAFGHPAVEAFFFWGLEGVTWHDRTGSGHDLEPAFARVRDLVHKEWTTHATLTSDEGGRIRFRGFFGDYALRYPADRAAKQGSRFSVDRQAGMPIVIPIQPVG